MVGETRWAIQMLLWCNQGPISFTVPGLEELKLSWLVIGQQSQSQAFGWVFSKSSTRDKQWADREYLWQYDVAEVDASMQQ